MAYIDHIHHMQTFTPREFVPLVVHDKLIGHVHHQNQEKLTESGLLDYTNGQLTFSKAIDTKKSRTEAVEELIVKPNLFPNMPLWDENLDVLDRWGGEVLWIMRRGLHHLLGTRTWGVHINGYTITNDKTYIWTAKRARTKKNFPGKMDDLVAGGIPSDHTPGQTVIKEAKEEADIPPHMAAQAKPVGVLAYKKQYGPNCEWNFPFIFDLLLPDDFIPKPNDGEVESFQLLPIEKVAEIVDTSFDYKDNCNLVIIDFLIRHGHIQPSHQDYLSLCSGLRMA